MKIKWMYRIIYVDKIRDENIVEKSEEGKSSDDGDNRAHVKTRRLLREILEAEVGKKD